MAKFVKIALQNLLDAGTDGTGTTSKLTVASTATFTVGDYVHNTTDNTYATITAIDSATVASLSADIMDAAETYAVYSATSATYKRLISAERFLLSEQPAPATNGIGATTVNYASGGTDVVTIYHVPQGALASGVAVAVENALISAHSAAVRPEPFSEVALPSGVVAFNLAIA